MNIIRLPNRSQRGKGVGSIFARWGSRFLKPLLKSAFKASKPMAKTLVKTLAAEGIQSAGNTVSDMIEGQSFKNALKSNAVKSYQKFKKRAKSGVKRKIDEAINSGTQVGSGSKRRKKNSSAKKRKKVKVGRKKSDKKKKKKTKKKKKKVRKKSKLASYRGIFS